MVNEKLIMSPDWGKTLAQFEAGEYCMFEDMQLQKGAIRSAINRLKKETGKLFTTKTTLKGNIEIKRIK